MTIDNNVAIDFYLSKIFPRKVARDHWLKTHNLLLDGECPDVLRESDSGQVKVLEVLKEMAGYRK